MIKAVLKRRNPFQNRFFVNFMNIKGKKDSKNFKLETVTKL